MSDSWGRFTERGSEAVEDRIRAIMVEAQGAFASTCGDQARAVVLLGGYGRGEGGVERRDDGDVPHNNFDFLAILEGGDTTAIKRRIDRALAPLVDQHGIGMDVGVVSTAELARAPSLVMWYDMRHGHKTILGDGDYVPSLDHFRLNRIPAWDVRNLLVNRGSLLLINDLILDRGQLDESDRRTIIKHAVKAVIGCGDAWLFFDGKYDWSYVEKQKRMAGAGAPERLRTLYDEAMEFRFEPNYGKHLDRDLLAWNDELRGLFSEVHLLCERKRLERPELRWDQYAQVAFSRALTDDALRPRTLAKKGVALLRPKGGFGGLGVRGQLGFWASRPRERLPVLFPAVTYDRMPRNLIDLARSALSAAGDRPRDLRRAYLRAWGEHGDTNFHAVLRKLRIDLEGRPR
ncbi:MAG: hypothetical protein KC416_05195 [Myxococcales bacterium]|nr:hypothetical protein [Myxococcales bacterium]